MPSGYVDLSTLHTPTPGENPPTAWGKAVNHDLRYLGDPPSATVSSGTQNITSGVDAILVASSARHDSGGLWSTSAPERLTVPQAGLYLAVVAVEVGAFAADNGDRLVTDFIINAATVKELDVRVLQPSPTPTRFSSGRVLELAAGDFVRVRINHNAGGTAPAVLEEFTLTWRREPPA